MIFIYFVLLILGIGALVASEFQMFHTKLWMLKVLADSYGHDAFKVLVILTISMYSWTKRRPDKNFGVLGLWGLVVACLFLVPTIQAVYFEPYAKTIFENRLKIPAGELHSESWFSWKEWAFGKMPDLKRYEAVEYHAYEGSKPLKAYILHARSAPAPRPWILLIHGGGWDGGDPKELPVLSQSFADQGYTVVTIDYRLAPYFQWPSPMEDVIHAIRFMKSRANEYEIDPNRFFILGRSAGGQIALTTAYQNPEPGLRGVISYYAPTDMKFGYDHCQTNDLLDSRTLFKNYLGGAPTEKPDAYLSASPILFARKDSVPTLLIHGLDDPLVWYRHSERLSSKLEAEGATFASLGIPRATHGIDFSPASPYGQIVKRATLSFLGRFSEFKPITPPAVIAATPAPTTPLLSPAQKPLKPVSKPRRR